jgi:hypothetical protein
MNGHDKEPRHLTDAEIESFMALCQHKGSADRGSNTQFSTAPGNFRRSLFSHHQSCAFHPVIGAGRLRRPALTPPPCPIKKSFRNFAEFRLCLSNRSGPHGFRLSTRPTPLAHRSQCSFAIIGAGAITSDLYFDTEDFWIVGAKASEELRLVTIDDVASVENV